MTFDNSAEFRYEYRLRIAARAGDGWLLGASNWATGTNVIATLSIRHTQQITDYGNAQVFLQYAISSCPENVRVSKPRIVTNVSMSTRNAGLQIQDNAVPVLKKYTHRL